MSAHGTPVVTVPQAATILSSHGVSVIPIASMETKAPRLASWKPFQSAIATPEDLAHWFTDNGQPAAPGIAIVCGEVSKGLTVIDFDTDAHGATLYPAYAKLIEQLCPGLLESLVQVATPSGGRHLYFRSEVVEGNAVLATTLDKRPLIETRGEGGYVVAPPSPGYRLLHGRLSDVPGVSRAQRDLLLNAARSLTRQAPPKTRGQQGAQALPGDAYNAQASLRSVALLLSAHGWSVVKENGDSWLLRRPGKDAGTSATLTLIDSMPVFYAFSTTSAPLPHGVGLSPFAVLAHLEHGGDFSAAARALAPAKEGTCDSGGTDVTMSQVTNSPPDYKLYVHSLNDLRRKTLPEAHWLVDNIIPAGCTLVAGAPKVGKSTLAWHLALAVAQGGYALGSIKVKKRDMLYIALEDSPRIVQQRMHRMLAEEVELAGGEVAWEWEPLDRGGVDMLRAYAKDHPDALVIIDTYQSLRARNVGGLDAYQNDYGALKPLQRMCTETGLNVVIVHHTNKQVRDDVMMTISGSSGLSACVDTSCVLHHDYLSGADTLHVRGREFGLNSKYALQWDRELGHCRLLGEVEDIGGTGLQQAIIRAIQTAGTSLGMEAITTATGPTSQPALRQQLARMTQSGALVRTERGKYGLPEQQQLPALVTCDIVTSVPTAVEPMSQVVAYDNDLEPAAVRTPQHALEKDAHPAPSVDTHHASITWAVQGRPCAGCGKTYSKRDSKARDNTMVCDHCGAEAPYLA